MKFALCSYALVWARRHLGYDLRVNGRLLPGLSACFGLVLVACSGGSHPSSTATAAARPTGVPAAAVPLNADTSYGNPSAPAGADPAVTELFFSSSCESDLVALTTNLHIVYAELPCDRALPASVQARFIGKPVRLRAVVGDPAKLYMDSAEGGSVELTVGRMWVVSM
jgi:hypothetical protein